MTLKKIGKTNIRGKLPTYEEFCDVSAKSGLGELACMVIAARMREKKVEPGKITVCRTDTGAEADAINVLELSALGAQRGTRLLVFTHDESLRPLVDEAAEIIASLGKDSPLA
ncbi:MAG: hypothetical protein PHE24_00190 [Patescibacteria group bacterium]|nr:hypothetical protein [Patescibacteria group bacterium]